MSRIVRYIVLLLVLVFVGAVVAGFYYLTAPYKGYAASEQFVDVPAGTSVAGIGERLASAGVVRNTAAFKLALWQHGGARRLQAGEYRFEGRVTPVAVIDKMARGDVFLISITFREGLTIAEMAPLFESRGFGPARAFVEAASGPAPIAPLDPEARDLEGYLFPDTYALPRRTTAPKLVALMTGRFRDTFTPALREEAKTKGLSVRQVVTLASLVEKETAKADERPVVAAVYLNRVRIGMGLQCDPTVIYALQRAGRYTGNLSRADLAIDSPYNTYRYAGLPPGPIAAPGRASIEAVVRPADVPYVYFVSRNDGSHAFAATLDEHNRNVQKFQVEYFRKN